jgi:hypothetical protein
MGFAVAAAFAIIRNSFRNKLKKMRNHKKRTASSLEIKGKIAGQRKEKIASHTIFFQDTPHAVPLPSGRTGRFYPVLKPPEATSRLPIKPIPLFIKK